MNGPYGSTNHTNVDWGIHKKVHMQKTKKANDPITQCYQIHWVEDNRTAIRDSDEVLISGTDTAE